MSNFIELSRLSPATKYAFEQYAERYYYNDSWLKSFMEPQWFAWLIELLKAEPDAEELFPNGKWATIQRMQELLAVAIKEETSTRAEATNDLATQIGQIER